MDYNLLVLLIKLYFCIVDLFVLVADACQRGHICSGHANINTTAVIEVTMITVYL